ncbi:hypothetical protein F4703DRAFT_1797202 [Phycomyces blakesleeanus]
MLINGGGKYNKAKRVKKRRKKKNGDTTFESLTRACTKKDKWKPTKYQQDSTKAPLAVFGSGMFGKYYVKLKGHGCGVVGKRYKLLKKGEAEGQLIVITIDKFKTSKTCNLCFFDDKKIIKTKSFKGVAVVSCKQQHDIDCQVDLLFQLFPKCQIKILQTIQTVLIKTIDQVA